MEPTTLHERVAAADPGPSRQGPPAYRPGNPVWDAGYETAMRQAAAISMERGHWASNDLDSDSMVDRFHAEGRMKAATEVYHDILAMRPAPPVMPPLPLTEG